LLGGSFDWRAWSEKQAVLDHRRLPAGGDRTLFLCIVQPPRDRIEKPDEASFADPPPKEWVRGKRSERIVSDLRIGRGRAAVDEGQILIGG
jgi:hypothetical protein